MNDEIFTLILFTPIVVLVLAGVAVNGNLLAGPPVAPPPPPIFAVPDPMAVTREPAAVSSPQQPAA